MHIYLVDTKEETVEAWKSLFGTVPTVSCHCDRIENWLHKSDGFVSVANSHLFMDGGSDLAYMQMFPGIQAAVKKHAQQFGFVDRLGLTEYLPVGAAMMYTTEYGKHLISAPTMLLPQNVASTQNAYHAFKLVLELMDKNPNVQSVVVPGMCTGYGRMPPLESAYQMHRAWLHHKNGLTLDTKPETKNLVYYPSILKQQPKYYCNSQFFDILPQDIVNM